MYWDTDFLLITLLAIYFLYIMIKSFRLPDSFYEITAQREKILKKKIHERNNIYYYPPEEEEEEE